MRKIFLFVMCVLAISACAEPTSTGGPAYTYVAPHTPGGVLCIDECRESHDFCRKSCALDYHSCVSDVQAVAQKKYEIYARQQYEARLPADKMPSEFEDTHKCADSNQRCVTGCDTPYNSCYSSCGGTVNAVSSCIFSCPE